MNNTRKSSLPPHALRRKKIVNIDFVEYLQKESNQSYNKEIGNVPSVSCHIDMVSSELITSYADVICFPMGSFFGSVIVNLIPKGVGKAIVQRQCPKIYIPNTGYDPEMYGYTLSECIEMIIMTIHRDADDRRADDDDNAPDSHSTHINVSDILNFVLIDTANCEYTIPIDTDIISKRWPTITILDICLVDHAESTKRSDADLVVPAESQKEQELDPTKVAEVLIALGS